MIWFHIYKSAQLEYYAKIIENDDSFIIINGFDKHLNSTQNIIKIDVLHAWLNINHDLNWNGPHQHGIGDMSGVIYLNNPCCYQICDEYQAGVVYHDTRRFGDDHARYLPCKGDIHIFPAWITHWTQPTYLPAPRISLAFNFDINIENVNAESMSYNLRDKFVFKKQLLQS